MTTFFTTPSNKQHTHSAMKAFRLPIIESASDESKYLHNLAMQVHTQIMDAAETGVWLVRKDRYIYIFDADATKLKGHTINKILVTTLINSGQAYDEGLYTANVSGTDVLDDLRYMLSECNVAA